MGAGLLGEVISCRRAGPRTTTRPTADPGLVGPKTSKRGGGYLGPLNPPENALAHILWLGPPREGVTGRQYSRGRGNCSMRVAATWRQVASLWIA